VPRPIARCPNHYHQTTVKQSEGSQPPFAIVEAIIDRRERPAAKHFLCIGKVQTALVKRL